MKKIWLLVLVLMLTSTLSTVAAQSERTVITPQTARQVTELIRLGRGTTEHVAVSPDGETIAVASTVGVWVYQASALDTPLEPPLLDTHNIAKALAFSPDGSLLAVTTEDEVQFWDAASLERVAANELERVSEAFAFSPDGSLLAFNLGYNGILLWNIADQSAQGQISANMQGNASVVFSPDGALIAGATSDYKVHLWQTADFSEVAALSGHTGYVYDLAFNADGSLLASASYDKTVRLWDAASGSEVGVLAGDDAQPLNQAYSVAFSPSGLLASGHANGALALWNVGETSLQSVITGGAGDLVDVAFSPDGAQIVTASTQNRVQAWDVTSGLEIARTVGHTNYIPAAVFSPDSAVLAIADWDENAWLWETANRQQLNFAPVVSNVTHNVIKIDNLLAYAPDGSLLATTDAFDIILLDAASGREVRRLDDCNGMMVSFAFSPDSTLLAVASSDGLCLFDVGTGDLSAAFTSNDWLNSVVFSPDQTMIATTSKDHTARVYGLP